MIDVDMITSRREELVEDLTKVIEISDETNLQDQAACAGGNCEIV